MAEHMDVMADLKAEGDVVTGLVSGLDAAGWDTPTPAVGWTVKHQLSHLAATFRLAGLAASEPPAFEKLIASLSDDFETNVRMAMSQFLSDPPNVLLLRWKAEKESTEAALAAVPDGQLVPWLVRPMAAPLLAAAGMMELFGHGQDIVDALGADREPTDRLGHVVAFAVRTWDFGYEARGLPTPDVAIRFEITAPSGTQWNFGPADATERISGPALDFCLLVTRRRHPDDLAIEATGPEAQRWLGLAQAYRGPAGPGRTPGQFARAAA